MMIDNPGDSFLLATLVETISLNNQAAEDMILQRYHEASPLLLRGLEIMQTYVANSNNETCGTTTTAVEASLQIQIAWDAPGNPSHDGDASHPPLFQKPLRLAVVPPTPTCSGSPSSTNTRTAVNYEEEEQQSDQHTAPSTTYNRFVRPVLFGIIINYAMCFHLQSLQEQTKSTSVSSSDPVAVLEKAIELYLQAGELARLFHQPSGHLELILLNNLGHAYQRLQCNLKALLCFQCLCVAAEEFKQNSGSVLYANNLDIQALVDSFRKSNHFLPPSNGPPMGAPVA